MSNEKCERLLAEAEYFDLNNLVEAIKRETCRPTPNEKCELLNRLLPEAEFFQLNSLVNAVQKTIVREQSRDEPKRLSQTSYVSPFSRKKTATKGRRYITFSAGHLS